MKTLVICTLAASLSLAGAAHAAEVEKAVDDNRTGQVFGGLTGVLLGGLAGPVGALVGGLSGAWLGGVGQSAAGLSQQAYEVRTSDGEVRTVRAPHQTFSPGDQVTLNDGRIQANP